MSRSTFRAMGALILGATLLACSTVGGGEGGIGGLGAARSGGGRRLVAVPSSLKVFPDWNFVEDEAAEVSLDAARGEAESSQLLLFSGSSPVGSAILWAGDLAGPGGFAIVPELGLVGYVPVTKPSFVGFHRRGSYPDPILPANPFGVAAGANQALWYNVRVPRDAPAGIYSGSVSVTLPEGSTLALDVELRVHDVTLPVTSYLKTRVNFRQENFRDERYYGQAWTAERAAALPELGLKYRFSTSVNLDLPSVFSHDAVLASVPIGGTSTPK